MLIALPFNIMHQRKSISEMWTGKYDKSFGYNDATATPSLKI